MAGVIFFDTETTGKWDFKADPMADHQPHCIQLAAIFDDESGNTTATLNHYLQLPQEVEIESGALKTHGITPKMCQERGFDPAYTFATFNDWLLGADCIVAHNADFDIKILAKNYKRYSQTFNPRGVPYFCTMQATTNVCKLPGKYNNYKWPKLEEAYGMLVDPAGFEGAHDALADVKACRALYYKMKESGHATGTYGTKS